MNEFDGLLEQTERGLLWQRNGEKLLLEGWGEGLRVRGTRHGAFSDEPWALLPMETEARVELREDRGVISNGGLTAQVLLNGHLTFSDAAGNVLLDELARNMAYANHPLRKDAREYRGLPGGDFRLAMRFDSDPDEKLFGMGQYQQEMLNLKGCILELAQRNTQASVPFAVSSKGYGFLWNNPAVGQVAFGRNYTEWTACSTSGLDFWITAGESPAQLLERYTAVTGRAPMMPEYAMGLWQCKLRYQTQEELLQVAREYKRRGIPLSVIVIDFWHWEKEGNWTFDERYWPDPAAMVRELNAMGVRVAVSIWPTVSGRSVNFREFSQKGLLVHAERGMDWCMDCSDEHTSFVDVTNPRARQRFWEIARQNYYERGLHTFWLDVAEPEFLPYDFDNFRYEAGPALQVSNLYPMRYAQTFYEGLRAEGETEIISLIRCAWAGSQRYGALAWSGDIHSTFETLRRQIPAGLNMGMAGICWWNTDVGGFQNGNIDDPAFRELLVRWFEYAVFTPVLRLHGCRTPDYPAVGTDGGGKLGSGAPNEVWSYGEEVEQILTAYVNLREAMRPYIRFIMAQAHETGAPVIRPLFFDAPKDPKSWEVEDQFLFGPAVLVAPVTYEGKTERTVYLPAGFDWIAKDGKRYAGGETITVPAPLDTIPVFVRADLANLDGLQALQA